MSFISGLANICHRCVDPVYRSCCQCKRC